MSGQSTKPRELSVTGLYIYLLKLTFLLDIFDKILYTREGRNRPKIVVGPGLGDGDWVGGRKASCSSSPNSISSCAPSCIFMNVDHLGEEMEKVFFLKVSDLMLASRVNLGGFEAI
jgi:hypothetical protein